MDVMQRMSDWVWQDYFWLPKGVSFRDLADKPGFVYARPRHLIYVPLIAIAINCVRFLFERIIALPVATYLGLTDGEERKRPESNNKLDEYFKEKSKHPSKLERSQREIEGLAKQLDWSTAAVERWFRRMRNLNRPSLRKKFCEASWRCLFYAFVFIYGISSLWQTPWFWDTLQCWSDYPRQSLEQSTFIYYMLEGGFYVSLLFTVVGDVKRKDFTEQLIHHMATLFLIGFSYVANFVRIGTLVMAVHDISDIFLEGAKCFVYLKWQSLADTAFVLFSVVFLFSRLVIYPFWILHTSIVKSMWLFDAYPGYYFFNGLLLILQVLHIVWSSIIIRMAFNMMRKGEVEKDDRSDVEEMSSEEEGEHAANANGSQEQSIGNGKK